MLEPIVFPPLYEHEAAVYECACRNLGLYIWDRVHVAGRCYPLDLTYSR
jgi:hypothetical protein